MTSQRRMPWRGALLGALVGFVSLAFGGRAPAQAATSTAVPGWTTLASSGLTAPAPRQGAAMAYDAATSQVVLFGGLSGDGNLLNDTWLWNGSAWAPAHPTTSPAPAVGAAMAYDVALHELVVFGGQTTTTSPPAFSDQTWAWNGASWYRIMSASAPPRRASATLSADDTGAGRFVLFGGVGDNGHGGTSPLADTWTFDGATWSSQHPATSPPARSGAAATWDAAHSDVVVSGGRGGPGASPWLADTWRWNGTTWAQMAVSAAPPARADATLTYDGDLGGDVLFGGHGPSGVLGDTSLLTGSAWTGIHPTAPPGARSRAAASWDAQSHQLLVFGGASGDGAVDGDTWALRPALAAPSPSPAPTVVPPLSSPPPGSSVAGPPRSGPSGSAPGGGGPSGGGPSGTSPQSTGPPVAGETPPAATTPPTTGGPVRPVATQATSTTTVLGASTRTTIVPAIAPLTATAPTLYIGQRVVLSGSGFAPGAEITISFHSTGVVVVGSIRADRTGSFTTTVAVPPGTPDGTHDFVATGLDSAGVMMTSTTAVDVTSAVGAPARGGGRTETLVMVGLAIFIPLATWMVLGLVSRRKQPTARIW